MNRTAKKIVSMCVLLSVNLPSFAQDEYYPEVDSGSSNSTLIVCLLIVNIILSIILLISKYKGKKE